MFLSWLSRLFGATASSEKSLSDLPDFLEVARALAKQGKTQEASEAYGKIKRKHRTVLGLVEHAEILIELGDDFGAAAKASQALELEPDNARAKAIQARIQEFEDKGRTR